MVGPGMPKRANSSASLSEDSDNGRSAKKKTKSNTIKSILKDDDFQLNWLKTQGIADFFDDIKNKKTTNKQLKHSKTN